MLGIVKVILIIAVVLAATLFTMANMVVVTVDFLVASQDFLLPLLVFIVLAIGLLAGYLVASVKTFRMSRTIRRLEREVRMAESEVSNLRSIPIKDVH